MCQTRKQMEQPSIEQTVTCPDCGGVCCYTHTEPPSRFAFIRQDGIVEEAYRCEFCGCECVQSRFVGPENMAFDAAEMGIVAAMATA